ncbi:MAG: neutral/alkaline non-lysosomal ceramidase N-terminal domain-containing protein [Candidatus Latescibacteria bacterium]|nr:neutral/alkaline non-lysosomal ceramidase N-terminal domain-containing protein [Candidatus Latescibacterota bacterium]
MDIGVARRTITPQRPVFLAGYASRDHESEGVYQDLLATAMMIGDGSTRAVILHADLLYLDENLVEAIEAGVLKKTHLRPDQLVLTTTHTHCGPSIRERDGGLWRKIDAEYLPWLIEQLVGVIVDAVADQGPGIFRYGAGYCDINVNRRVMTDDGIAMRPNLVGAVDKRVHVIEAVDINGETKGVLYSYTCHPTTMGGYQIGGDYPGFATRFIEDQFPGTLALFVQGCSGNIRPNNIDEDGAFRSGPLEIVERFGTALGHAVAGTLDGRSMREVYGNLSLAHKIIELPLAEHPTVDEVKAYLDSDNQYRRIWAEKLLALDETGENWPTTMPFHFQQLTIGDQLTLVALSGEVCVEIAWRIEHLMMPRPTIVAGYTNASITYIPSKAIYHEGGYEVDGSYFYDILPSPYAYNIEDLIAQTAYDIIPRCKGGDRRRAGRRRPSEGTG